MGARPSGRAATLERHFASETRQLGQLYLTLDQPSVVSFFRKEEIPDICARQLDVDGEMTARDLPEPFMAENELNISDNVLRNSVVFKLVQALQHAKRRKLVRMVERSKGMCIWTAGDTITLRVVVSIPSNPDCRAQQAPHRSDDPLGGRCFLSGDPQAARHGSHRRRGDN